MIQLASELQKTDQLADRWAKSDRPTGSLHPLEAIRLMHDGAVLGGFGGLPADVATFDEVYCTSPVEVKAFVSMWYKDAAPVYLKANRLNVSRATLYNELKGHLNYLRGRLHAKGIDV